MNSTLHPFAARGAAAETARPTRESPPSRSDRQLAAERAFARHDFGDHVEVVELADWQVDEDRDEWWRPVRARLKAHPDRSTWLIFSLRFLEGERAVVQGAHATDHTGAPWGVAREVGDAWALAAADRALLLAALESHGERLAKSAVAAPGREAAMRMAALTLRLNRMKTGA